MSTLASVLVFPVVLPPTKEDGDTTKLLTMDKEKLSSSSKKLLGSDITTDNNLDRSTTGGISVEVSLCLISSRDFSWFRSGCE